MDMEKGIQQAMGAAPDAQVPPMPGKGEKEPQLANLHVHSVEGVLVTDAANNKKVNPGQTTKWRLPYWIVAGSAMVLTNGITTHAGPKYKLIPPEAAAMAGFLCATIDLLHFWYHACY